MTDACIIGAGIHPFGRTPGMTGMEMGVAAIRMALADAGVSWEDIQFAYGGSDSAGNPDTIIPRLGLSGIQFVNISNGCATGGAALFAAVSAILAGQYDLGVVVGFDKHPRGAFDPKAEDWGLPAWYGQTGLMLTTQFFAMKIRRYMTLYGISQIALGRVAEKSFRNGQFAEHAWRREPIGLDAILAAPMLADPFTKYMLCSPAEGAAALVIASECRARQIKRLPIRIRSVAMRTRPRGSFEVFSPMLELESSGSATQLASRAAFEQAGMSPRDIHVAQLQDTESGAEIMHLAENGFCADGDQEGWLEEGRTEIGGLLPVNTDGGCIACGEPIGASGLRQVYENVIQLRGIAGARQVPGKPSSAYSHVYGAPGVAAVTILVR